MRYISKLESGRGIVRKEGERETHRNEIRGRERERDGQMQRRTYNIRFSVLERARKCQIYMIEEKEREGRGREGKRKIVYMVMEHITAKRGEEGKGKQSIIQIVENEAKC